MSITLKLRRYLMKRNMRKKVKRAFAPYHRGEKTFIECQCNALTGVLGGPAVERIE